jgi:MarR family transcriptional regulator for hemolysin
MTDIRQQNEQRLTSGLILLARVYRKEVNRSLSAYGLSDAQAVPVLHIARSGGGLRQHQLAEEIGIKGPSLVRLLDQLCTHGLVERRDDDLDRRAKTLHLTTAGEALAERVEEVLAQIRRRLLARVDDAELATALKVIEHLQSAIDAGHAAPQGTEGA